MFRITANTPRGLMRAGVHHPAQPVMHPGDRFTAEQLAQLTAEPLLTVEVLGDEPPPAKPKKK